MKRFDNIKQFISYQNECPICYNKLDIYLYNTYAFNVETKSVLNGSILTTQYRDDFELYEQGKKWKDVFEVDIETNIISKNNLLSPKLSSFLYIQVRCFKGCYKANSDKLYAVSNRPKLFSLLLSSEKIVLKENNIEYIVYSNYKRNETKISTMKFETGFLPIEQGIGFNAPSLIPKKVSTISASSFPIIDLKEFSSREELLKEINILNCFS